MMLFCCEAKTQTNLVYNGDFEIYSSCPSGISSPFSLPYEIEKCTGWTSPSYATSDYFNVCSSSVNVPNNFGGFQNAKNGNGYCGFIAYSSSSGGCYTGDYWWEYIQGHFTSPLISNHKYRIGFYISLGEASNIAVKNIGLYISQNSMITNTCSPAPIYVTPQIMNNNGLLTDTINWVLISGEYLANGGENYITIGHFADSLTTDTLIFGSISTSPFCYYYADDAFVIDETDSSDITDCEIKIPNIFTPNTDNTNDIFKFNTCNNVLKTCIYNRWGNLIFRTERINHYWDGRTTSGEECSEGNYFFLIQTEKETYKGFVQLMR